MDNEVFTSPVRRKTDRGLLKRGFRLLLIFVL